MKDLNEINIKNSEISTIKFYSKLVKYGSIIIVVYSLINTLFTNYYESFWVKTWGFLTLAGPLFLGLLLISWFISAVVVFLINTYKYFFLNIMNNSLAFKSFHKLLFPVYILCFGAVFFLLIYGSDGAKDVMDIFIPNLIFLLVSAPFLNPKKQFSYTFWSNYRYITMAITLFWLYVVAFAVGNSTGMEGVFFLPAYFIGIIVALIVATCKNIFSN